MIDDLREASEVRNIHRWDYPPINIHVCVYCYILCVRINPIQPHLSSNLVERCEVRHTQRFELLRIESAFCVLRNTV